jgi:hypothetical protein
MKLVKPRDSRSKEIARIIRKAMKEAEADSRAAMFDPLAALAMLAPLDAERLKMIAQVFTAMRPFARRGDATGGPPKSEAPRRRRKAKTKLKLVPKP